MIPRFVATQRPGQRVINKERFLSRRNHIDQVVGKLQTSGRWDEAQHPNLGSDPLSPKETVVSSPTWLHDRVGMVWNGRETKSGWQLHKMESFDAICNFRTLYHLWLTSMNWKVPRRRLFRRWNGRARY
jgi:hypothetical protein